MVLCNRKVQKGQINGHKNYTIPPTQSKSFWKEHQRQDQERNTQHPEDIITQQALVHYSNWRYHRGYSQNCHEVEYI